MYTFLKLNMKYPAICTPDGNNWILVGCTEEQLKTFPNESNTPLIRGEEGIWVVNKSDTATKFMIDCAALPHRLSPMMGENQRMPYESFYEMHKYFYINNNFELMVKGVVFNVNPKENPFQKANEDPETGFKCLADIKLNG